MAAFSSFERDFRLVANDFPPELLQRELATFAKQELAGVIRSGQASPVYERAVNGRIGAPEESVKLPGPITYVFQGWPDVINAALVELRKRIRQRSGRYGSSFVVTVNDREVTDFSTIDASEVIIFNRQPYTRKMEVGANTTGAKHFDLAASKLKGRFSNQFAIKARFINVSGGVAQGVPYILKGSVGRRKDRQAGQPITYPALVIFALGSSSV